MSQTWGTPWHIVRALEHEIGAFDLDVCATPENTKAREFIALPRNGLTADWARRNFCNPPYDNQAAWLARAAWWAASCSHTTACLVRAAVDTRYWFRLVASRATTDFFVGRIAFLDPVTGRPRRGTSFASAVAIYGPDFEPGLVRWRDAETGQLIDVRSARALRTAEVLT